MGFIALVGAVFLLVAITPEALNDAYLLLAFGSTCLSLTLTALFAVRKKRAILVRWKPTSSSRISLYLRVVCVQHLVLLCLAFCSEIGFIVVLSIFGTDTFPTKVGMAIGLGVAQVRSVAAWVRQ